MRIAAALCAALVSLASCGGKGDSTGPQSFARFVGGAVADEPRAARQGLDALNAGGTAADAATALYFSLAVTLPSVASLGGGGVCLVYDPKLNRTEMLDFTARRPAAGGPIAVPAMARGILALQARYGKLRWEQLVGQAETLARLGHPVSRALAADLLAATPILRANPALAAVFLRADGRPYGEGEMLVQRDLAATLAALRMRGVGELYGGALGRQFVDGARGQGAALAIEDLRAVEAAWRPSLSVTQDDFRFQFASPPALAGLVQAELLGMTAPRWKRAPAAERTHLFAEASARAWLDRDRWLAADQSVTAAPPELASERYLNGLMANYRSDQRTAPQSTRAEPLADDAAATGFVIVDRDGLAIACTVSTNGLFGAGRMAAGTGIVLAASPDAVHGPQWLGPIMAIHLDRGTFTFGIGTKGGPQLILAAAGSGGAAAISALAAVALHTMIEGQNLESAIDAQRIHADGAPGGTVFVESSVQPRPAGLAERGYDISPTPVLGRVNGVFCPGGHKDDPGGCEFRADRRGFGLAAGGL